MSSASIPAQAVAKAISGKRSQLIMHNRFCVSCPDNNYHHITKLQQEKDAFTVELKKYGTDYIAFELKPPETAVNMEKGFRKRKRF